MQSITPESLATVAASFIANMRARSSGSKRFTDKTLDNCFELGLLAMLFPKARILHCVRDARDTCLSIFFQNFLGLTYANNLRGIGMFYRQYRRIMAHWSEVLPSAPLDVVYEDVVKDPETVVRAILDYCGLSWDPNCLEFHNAKRVTITASAHQVKLPIYARSVGRWRNYEGYIQPLVDELDAGGCL